MNTRRREWLLSIKDTDTEHNIRVTLVTK